MNGKRLADLRKARNLNIEDVAPKIGVSPRTYYSYESNQRDPSTLTLAKIAIFFGVSADYLIDIENNQNNISLTAHETSVITAYRNKPEMQKSIDKLLDVENE